MSITDEGSGDNGTILCIHGTPGTIFDFRYTGGELVRAPMKHVWLDTSAAPKDRRMSRISKVVLCTWQ